MTFGAMLTLLNIRVDDTRTVGNRWTDVQKLTELNNAARFVLRQIAKHQGWVNYANDSVDITTDGTNKQFTISDTGFEREFYVTRTDTDDPESAYRIDERDETQWSDSSGFDADGRLVYFIRFGEDGTAYLKFPVVHPSGYILHVEMIQTNTDLATDGTASASTFSQIPTAFHELVVQRAAVTLLSADGVDLTSAGAIYSQLEQDMKEWLSKRSRPRRIKNHMQYGYA